MKISASLAFFSYKKRQSHDLFTDDVIISVDPLPLPVIICHFLRTPLPLPCDDVICERLLNKVALPIAAARMRPNLIGDFVKKYAKTYAFIGNGALKC